MTASSSDDTRRAAPPPRLRKPSALDAHRRHRLQHTLRATFGLRQLRDGQAEVIARVLDGKPTLAVMPTGAGKSLCYQLPALLLEGTTVVVSPLIALMKDQCDKMRARGVAAFQLNSAIDATDRHDAEAAIREGRARIVFTTPEKLSDGEIVAALAAHPVALLVIDEAHCISQWGHDFRPAFLEIGSAHKAFGAPPLLALTATASDAVAADIVRQLGVRRFGIVKTGVYRPNLLYRVEQVTSESDKLARVLALVRSSAGAGIVYAATVKAVDAVYDALREAGEAVGRYHGKLSASERRESQNAFIADRVRVMVATNAFGLGIDKPDTRFVLHYQMPAGLDAYYQESGRGGRDGEAAECTLLFLRRDKAVQQFFLAGRYPESDDVDALCRALLQTPLDGATAWTLDAVAAALDRPRNKLQVALRLLRHQGMVAQARDGGLTLLDTTLDGVAIAALLDDYRLKREADRAMLEQMVFYGQTGHCRWQVLLEHFAEADGFTRCGSCDNCGRLAKVEGAASSSTADATAIDATVGLQDASLRASKPTDRGFAAGTAVRVPRYGRGVVESSDAHTVTVRFANGTSRCFQADFVKAA